jgi:hypothetical protein
MCYRTPHSPHPRRDTWFLHSLLQYYGLELHNLTPSGVLHIAAFVSLCEAYLGIDPEFDLWNYSFQVWHPTDPDIELTVSRGMVIHVKSGHGGDPYIDILMPRSMKGWRKKCFTSGTMPPCRSPHLLVATPFRCLPRWMGWLGRTSASCSPCAMPFSSCHRRG